MHTLQSGYRGLSLLANLNWDRILFAGGAAGAVLILGVLYSIVRGRFDQQLATLLGVNPTFLPLWMMGAMLLLGALLGGTTAWLSLRKAVKL